MVAVINPRMVKNIVLDLAYKKIKACIATLENCSDALEALRVVERKSEEILHVLNLQISELSSFNASGDEARALQIVNEIDQSLDSLDELCRTITQKFKNI